jgi:hypothetical protein
VDTTTREAGGGPESEIVRSFLAAGHKSFSGKWDGFLCVAIGIGHFDL